MNNHKSMLLILESDLSERYSFLESKIHPKKIVFDLQNILKHSPINLFLSRLKYKKNIQREYLKHKKIIADFDTIFVSNGEGFIAKNILEYISKDFPEIKIVTLQHGIFVPKTLNFWKNSIRRVFNYFSNLFFGVYLIGTGFGSIHTHKIIVYNKIYKDILIKQGWNPLNVIVSSYILKGRSFHKDNEKIASNEEESDCVIFFLQPLAESGCANKKTEEMLNYKVIDRLSRNFETIFIKEHPLSPKRDYDFSNKNIEIIDSNLKHFLSRSKYIVSYFSTALLEYETEPSVPVAILSKDIIVDNDIYSLFKHIHNLDDNDSTDFVIMKNKQYKYGNDYFFETGMNLEDLNKCIFQNNII